MDVKPRWNWRNSLFLWIACLPLLVAVTGCGDDGGFREDGGLDADGSGDSDGLVPWPAERDLTCEQVKVYLDAADPRMLALNVSDEEFYDLGSIPGSIKIPWDLLPDRTDEVDPARHVVIYCRRGVRSESAYTTLSDEGFAHLWVMAGGIERWNELDYPTEP
jgi:sulfur-carrier protein adenylyltransferase/sulfurtransferase